jgi:type II secretory pathway pseudopilin PulG
MRRTRSGLTIVEALIATALMGVAGSMLAASFTVAGTARRNAARDARAAQALRERIAVLSRRPCAAPDTAGVDASGGATVFWTAHRAESAWRYSDSVIVPGAVPHAPDGGLVPCT